MMNTVTYTLVSLLAFGPALLTSAQMYNIDNMFSQGDLPYLENESGHRIMRIDTGNRPDLNQTANVCNAVGPRMMCAINSRISSRDNTFTDLAVTVNCQLDSQIAFDFRKARGCTCLTQATPSDGSGVKQCPCVVCPDGYGNAPVSIDCSSVEEDPYVINTCTSLDCDFSCNGTCSYDCVGAGPECAFCVNPTEAPTDEEQQEEETPPTTGGGGEVVTPSAPTNDSMISPHVYALVGLAIASLLVLEPAVLDSRHGGTRLLKHRQEHHQQEQAKMNNNKNLRRDTAPDGGQ